MRQTLAGLLILAAASGRAADLPPAPPAGAPVEERLYLASAASDGAGLLAARIACVAFQRARLEARLEEGLLARGWSAEADRLWRLSEALARFEAAHIRPLVDEETQSVLLDAYFPEGIAAAPDGPARADRCRAFGEAYMLRRVLG